MSFTRLSGGWGDAKERDAIIAALEGHAAFSNRRAQDRHFDATLTLEVEIQGGM